MSKNILKISKTNITGISLMTIMTIIAISLLTVVSISSASGVSSSPTVPASTATPVASPAATPTTQTPITNLQTSSTPTIDSIKTTDSVLTGNATSMAKIELKYSNGNVVGCKNSPIVVDTNRKYSCDLINSIAKDMEVTATATEDGKSQSLVAKVMSIEEPIVPSLPTLVIDSSNLIFNIPSLLQNSMTPKTFTANLDLSLPNSANWKLLPGMAIPTLSGLMPAVLEKDSSNSFSVLLSNQTSEIEKKPAVRIAMDQESLDKASGVQGFKPVEIGGASDLIRIPNMSTEGTNDWWYVPRSSIEVNGYKAIENDAKNFETDEATNGFYKGLSGKQIKPNGETYPYSFLLQGAPKSFNVPDSFALNLKANTPENITDIDAIVKGSKFDNFNNKFAIPELITPKITGMLSPLGVNTPSLNGWNWWWLLPLLALLLLLALLWWLAKYFGLFGNIKDKEVDYTTPTRKSYIDTVATANDKMNTTTNTRTKNFTNTVVAPIAPIASRVQNTRKDDFQVVEGIGPVINGYLHDAGVNTYQDLANSTEEKLIGILKASNVDFLIYNPKTWAQQANLAAQGKFVELEKLKEELYKGL
jgi:predicted flap endonuclease-1-like 5' DNA nuclease